MSAPTAEAGRAAAQKLEEWKLMNRNHIDAIIRWIGTTQSLLAHTVFFLAMLALRLFGVSAADTLLILTTVVSLEAIYLSIFIQMAVNRQADEQLKTRDQLVNSINEIQETIDELDDEHDAEQPKQS